MDNLDQRIHKELKKWRNRIFTKEFIDSFIIFSSCGVVAAIGFIILSKFIPIYSPYTRCLWIILLFQLVSVGYSIVNYPKEEKAAFMADSFGLKERVVTALELRGKMDSLGEMQKRDALNVLTKISSKSLKLKPQSKYLKVFAIICLVMASTLILPDPLGDRAKEIHDVKIAKKSEIKKIENIKKHVDKESKLKEWEKKTVNHNLAKLQEDIKKSSSKEEINKSIERSEKKLELLREEYVNKDLDKIADAFIKNKGTKELGKALKNKEQKAIKKSMQEAVDKLKNMSEQDRKKLAESFKNLSKELKDNPQMANAIQKLGEAMASGELGDLSLEMNNLSKQMSKLMNNKDFQEAVKQVESALSNGLSGENNKEAATGNGQGEGTGKSEKGENAQGNSPGNESGEKGGSSGNGAGSGSGEGQENGEANGNEGSNGINNKNGNSERNLKEYEKIFTTRTLGGDGKQSNIRGQRDKKGASEEIKTSKGFTLKGESIPYNGVIGEYRNKAVQGLNSSSMPEAMKEIIKNYFSSLEE